MTGAVTLDNGSERHAIRLTSSAMYRMEQAHDGKSFLEILKGLEDDFSLTRLVGMFCEMINDGEGGAINEALEIMDKFGFAECSDAFSRAVNVATPSDEAPNRTERRASAKKAKAAK